MPARATRVHVVGCVGPHVADDPLAVGRAQAGDEHEVVDAVGEAGGDTREHHATRGVADQDQRTRGGVRDVGGDARRGLVDRDLGDGRDAVPPSGEVDRDRRVIESGLDLAPHLGRVTGAVDEDDGRAVGPRRGPAVGHPSAPQRLAPGDAAIGARFLGEAERALGEVVALHLVGAAADRDAVPAEQLGLDPAADLVVARAGRPDPRSPPRGHPRWRGSRR